MTGLPPLGPMFAGIARGYDRFNAAATLGLDRAWRRAAARAVACARPSPRVIDVCAGTGELTLAIAREAGPRRLVAADVVPEMVSLARHKAAAQGLEAAIEFAVADAEDLPFGEGEFDVLTVGFGVRNLTSRRRAFAEFHRVLAAGGLCVVLELGRPRNPVLRAGHGFYMATAVPLLGGLLTGSREAYSYLRRSVLAFPEPEVISQELTQAGFQAVSWRRLSLGVATLFLATR